jgi:hypothetical protein
MAFQKRVLPGRSIIDLPGRTPGASATFLSTRVRDRYAASYARLLALSGAAAFGVAALAVAPPAARPPSPAVLVPAPPGPAPLSAAFGRTQAAAAVLPNPASLAGDDASAARYTPQRPRASNDALK